MTDPWPLTPEQLAPALDRLEAGEGFREVFEELLRDLPLEAARQLMLLHREGRGAWALELAGAGGRALFVGSGFSGTPAALARAGFEVVLADGSAQRLRFGRARLAAEGAAAEGAAAEGAVRLGSDGRLPFAGGSFELAVLEPPPPGSAEAPACPPAELARVTRGEVALVAENRFAYKRSAGHRGQFRRLGPRELVRRLARPAPGEHTLEGHRQSLGSGPSRAFALYPHSQDYTHVVALDGALPQLRIGAKERRNLAKTVAQACGLFPWLAPSFLLLAGPAGEGARIERVLAELSERLGEPSMELEELVATRGNNALALTRRSGDRRPGGPGRLALHVPLSTAQRRLVERHAAALRELPSRFPRLDLPRLRFEGQVDGLYLVAEERVEGLSAPQLSGDRGRVARTLADLAGQLAQLRVAPPSVLDEDGFEADLGQKFDLVTRHAPDADARRRLASRRARARELLVGRRLPRGVVHGDLRAKHVQVGADGKLLAVLDWGTWEEGLAVGFDLAHFLVHEWKQTSGESPGACWRRLLERRRGDAAELAQLDAHAAAWDVESDVLRTLAELHPVLVAAVAERTWDYSRPRWLERAYSI